MIREFTGGGPWDGATHDVPDCWRAVTVRSISVPEGASGLLIDVDIMAAPEHVYLRGRDGAFHYIGCEEE